ncbi:AAA family ATPase [candidate division KSB1 bacterium]|nr:AAA family ATPase [candidate division KSB1 bacterium]
MYISHIHLKNWKNFQDVRADLGQRVFLIGPNASGKSNLLDVFRFLRDVATDGLEKAVSEKRNGVSSIRCLAARKYTNIDIEVKINDGQKQEWRYRLSINQDNIKRPVVRDEIVIHLGKEVLKRPDTKDEQDPLRLTQTALEQISENQAFRPVADFFKIISYQHLLPQVVRDPRGFSPQPVLNDPFGRDFLLRLWKTLPRTRDSRLKKISSALQHAVPQLTELTVDMDKSTGTPHLIGSYSHWRPHDAKQNERVFSDGTLRLLGLLWTVYDGSGPLLLEEPEISLHPEVVRRLPIVFHRINRSRKEPRQIIISTHSDEMLQDKGIGPEEVLRLEPRPGGTEICMADEADRQGMASGLSAADLFMPKAAPKDIHQLSLEFADDY